MTHPLELLAEYVDGSLEARERADVDAHLDGCASCRDEVDLAARARSALASLPELEVPANTVRPGLQRAPRRVRLTGKVPWAAGFAAAASIAAIVSLVVLAGDGGPNGNQAARGSPESVSQNSVAGPVRVKQSGVNYDGDKIRELASSLADRYAQRTASTSSDSSLSAESGAGSGGGGSSVGGSGVPAASPTPAGEATAPTAGTTFDALHAPPTPAACIRRGAELPKSARPVEIIAAKFQGVPAYIGAFIQDGTAPDRLALWVVNRKDCSIMTVVLQPL